MPEYNITAKDQFDYAWKHFSFLADQRLKTFNYYIVLLAASMAGNIAVFDKMLKPKPVIAFGIWHIFIGLMFLLVDLRNRELIEGPRKSLRYFEKHKSWRGPKPMSDDYKRMARMRGGVSHTFAFRLTFLVQMAFGVGVLVYSYYRFFPVSEATINALAPQ
jgi:hypothetical protein